MNFESIDDITPLVDDYPSEYQLSREAKCPEPSRRPTIDEMPEGDFKGIYWFPGKSQFALGLKYENVCRVYNRDQLDDSTINRYRSKRKSNGASTQ